MYFDKYKWTIGAFVPTKAFQLKMQIKRSVAGLCPNPLVELPGPVAGFRGGTRRGAEGRERKRGDGRRKDGKRHPLLQTDCHH